MLLSAGLLAILGAIGWLDRRAPRRQGEHHLLLLSSLTGMLLLTGVRDLVLLVVAFELAGLPTVAMAGLGRDRPGSEGALKLYLSSAASSAITLYGFSLLWGLSGTTRLAGLVPADPSGLQLVGLALVLAGMAFKMGLVPFHFWMADTYEGSPPPTTAWLSVAPKVAVSAAFVRLLLDGMQGAIAAWGPLLLVLALLSLVQGNLSALPQRDARRLLALSGVAHMGLAALALVAGSSLALAALLFYSAIYVATNLGAFLAVGVVTEDAGTGDLGAFAGLWRRAPALSLALLTFLLSLGGIPFVAGFWGKLVLLWAAWKGGLAPWVILAAVIAVVALFYYLQLARSVYIESADTDRPVEVDRPTAWAIGLCAALVVGLGVFPGLLFHRALLAAWSLLGAS